MKRVKIAAGLSHVDFGHLYDAVAAASAAGVDYIHADCADMTSITRGPLMPGGAQIIAGIRPATTLPIEVHAHVQGATVSFIDDLAKAGANLVILPALYYMDARLLGLLRRAREIGLKFGFTITAGAPLCVVEESLCWLDRIHITTHDAVPDGRLKEAALPMVRRARQLIDERNPNCELCCDGGIKLENLHKVVAAGADVIEFCRPIFRAKEGIPAAVQRLRKAIDEASAKCEG